MPTVVRTSDLSKRYGTSVAVAPLSLDVQAGEIFGVLGPNGAGKSTILHMLTGLVRPSGGRVSLFGREIPRRFIDIAPRMGVLVERPAFWDHLSVEQNLRCFARLSGKPVSIDRTLDLVGLLHLAHAAVRNLSPGMRQRLGLAQAFLGEPELLILDEPTSALDVESAQEVLTLLRRLSKESGVTIVLSSHMMHEVESLCDRIAIVNGGMLVSCDRTDALISYDQSTVEVLIDSPEAASKRLAQETWVESVERRPGRLLVRLSEGNSHQLTAFLIASGYQVYGILPRRRTLQEYFLRVLNR